MREFLTLKHWQLFLLIVICGAWVSPSPLREIINGISFITCFCWIFAIGKYGDLRIKELGIKPLNVRLFTFNLVLIAIFFAILLIQSVSPFIPVSDTFTIWQIPFDLLLLYFVVAAIQTLLFACKTMVTIESRREVSFSNYFPTFLLMLFLFIGVWIIQPRVYRIFSPKETNG
jgi:hypothetical protein